MSAALLAADLFDRALPVLAATPSTATMGARAAALAAIDSFLQSPGPARHLSAVRSLSLLRRAALRTRLDATFAERAFRRGLEDVHATLGPMVAAELAPLAGSPSLDRRAGARLLALAALAEARAELAERITSEAAALRSRLTFRPTPPPPEGRLAFAGRRKTQRAARRARKR